MLEKFKKNALTPEQLKSVKGGEGGGATVACTCTSGSGSGNTFVVYLNSASELNTYLDAHCGSGGSGTCAIA